MTLLSVFGGGLWIIPLLTIALAAWLFYKAYNQSKSGSFYGRKGTPSDENVPFISTPNAILGFVAVGFLVIELLIMIANR